MGIVPFFFFFLLPLTSFIIVVVHSATTIITTSSGTNTLSFPPLTLQNGFQVENVANGFRLVQNGGQNPGNNIIPSRFRVVNIVDSGTTMVRVTQWDNYPNVRAPFPPFNVPNPFRVIRTNSGRFTIRGPAQEEFDVAGSSFYVERISAAESRVTVSTSTDTGNNGQNINNGGQNGQQQQGELLEDKTKPDGNTDCGPNIAHLCNNPLYAQLMRDQCPATCATFPNAAAPISAQQFVQPAAAQPVISSPPTWRPLGGFYGVRMGGCGRRK